MSEAKPEEIRTINVYLIEKEELTEGSGSFSHYVLQDQVGQFLLKHVL